MGWVGWYPPCEGIDWVLSVPVIPDFSWTPVGNGPLRGENVPVGCESPAVPVCAGPWLGPGLMVRYLYSVKKYLSCYLCIYAPIKTSAIAVFLRQKLHIWTKLNSEAVNVVTNARKENGHTAQDNCNLINMLNSYLGNGKITCMVSMNF